MKTKSIINKPCAPEGKYAKDVQRDPRVCGYRIPPLKNGVREKIGNVNAKRCIFRLYEALR